ncbi:Ferric reduction oxidase 2 [Spatholobus suberectus]|nr:Ferric reduction oxidase 2 [Spatholobus suberectus]
MFASVALEAANKREQVWEAKLECSALTLGLVGNICLVLLFFPVSRGSSILRFIGLTSEGSINYHIWLGNIAMAFFTTHGLGCFIFWDKTHQISEIFKWNKVGISNVAGAIALLAGLIMILPIHDRPLPEIPTVPVANSKFRNLVQHFVPEAISSSSPMSHLNVSIEGPYR